MAKISFRGRSIDLPKNRKTRIALGTGLTLAGGLGGWLPVLGFWMVPLGLLILSVDIPRVRRWRRRATVSSLRWWRGEEGRGAPPPAKPPLEDTSTVS